MATRQIAGFPAGFLDLVGSQNLGEGLRELDDSMRGVVDIGELLLVSRQESLGSTTTALINNSTNLTFPPAVQVPVGEVWRINQVSGVIVAPAGASVNVVPIVVLGQFSMAIGPLVAVAANQTRFAYATEVPFWLPAGAWVSVYSSELVAGPPTCSMAILFNRLKR